jgi:hypothetical protein
MHQSTLPDFAFKPHVNEDPEADTDRIQYTAIAGQYQIIPVRRSPPHITEKERGQLQREGSS